MRRAGSGSKFLAAAAGSGYDQFTVGGSVALNGALDLVTSPNLAPGGVFIILNKSSAGAITGTFTGKPNNSTFTSADGYTFRINYDGSTGNDVVLTLLASPIEQWRFTHFGSMLHTGAGLDTADIDGDGAANLVEYATKMNPAANDSVPVTVSKSAGTLDFIYKKSKAATDITCTVEWSDTLLNDWSAAGVGAPEILSDDGTTQQIKVTVPAGSGITRRFVHLRVTRQ